MLKSLMEVAECLSKKLTAARIAHQLKTVQICGKATILDMCCNYGPKYNHVVKILQLSLMSANSAEKKPTIFILDVDGVLTNGQFLYTSEGKTMKMFGPDDNDGLSLLQSFMAIRFVTGDKKGFDISKKRIVDDMKYALDLVSTIKRIDWISERYPLDEVIYMGDGIFDHYVMNKVGYSIAPSNADFNAKSTASYVTNRSGGDRAVAEACLHIMEKFFTPFKPAELPNVQHKLSGEWAV